LPPPPQTFTLSLHDALPISCPDCARGRHQADASQFRHPALHHRRLRRQHRRLDRRNRTLTSSSCLILSFLTLSELSRRPASAMRDRKSTRLNSSHVKISYAV